MEIRAIWPGAILTQMCGQAGDERGEGRRSKSAKGQDPVLPALASGGWLARYHSRPSPFRVLARWTLFNGFYRLRGRRPFRPLAMCLYVTYRCNMRCQMCGIWSLPEDEKGGEWSLAELDRMLRDPLLSRLEFVNINGGEPNLRTDLVEIAELLLTRLPELNNLTLNTNGLPTERCVENCHRILTLCQAHKVRFGVSVSLHRIGAGFDEIAGIPDAYRKVKATLDALKSLRSERGFYLSANCVLTPANVGEAEGMLRWGADEGIPVNFTVAETRERFNNLGCADVIAFTDPGDRRRLVEFLRRLGTRKDLVGHHAIRYRELANMIERGRPRTLACHYALAGLILGWDGTIFYCKKSAPLGNIRERPGREIYFDRANLAYRHEELLRQGCSGCLPNTFNSIELQKDLVKLVTLLR